MTNDVQLILRWRASIIHFIEDIWGLIPQPLKPEVPNDKESSFYKPEHFEPFKNGTHITWQQWLFFREIDDALSGGKLIRTDSVLIVKHYSKSSIFLSVSSGHGTAKSTDESIVIFWGLTCWLDTNIGCTAPTSDQMYDVLWKEAAKWHRKMPQALADCFEIQQAYIRVKERPETWWARARTARKEAPEALAGLHAKVIIILVDEASGVPEEIFEVAQGALTGAFVIFIMVSNPTRLSGFFYDSHHKNRKKWRCLTFNSEESPIVDPEYPKRIADQYGIESPQYKIRVQGVFPDAEEDQLIPRSLFDEAAARPRARDVAYVRCLGVDVARYGGDKTALSERQGGFMAHVKTRQDQDTVATANDVMAELRKAKTDGNPYDFVMVDIIGLGAGTFDTLKDRQKNGEIPKTTRLIGVNVALPAEDEAEHTNLRTELWYRYRDALKTGNVDTIFRDDSCAVKYSKPDSKGRNVLEPKEKTKERLGSSPDIGDSIVLTFVIGNMRRKAREDALHPMNRKQPIKLSGWHEKLRGQRS